MEPSHAGNSFPGRQQGQHWNQRRKVVTSCDLTSASLRCVLVLDPVSDFLRMTGLAVQITCKIALSVCEDMFAETSLLLACKFTASVTPID